MKNTNAIFFLAVLVCMSGCADLKPAKLTVLEGNSVIYQCETGLQITAVYYTLSDGSLNFVKITLPGGQEQTLPQVLSASGERYTDERELIWWTKGITAFAETRDENSQWQILYQDCHVIVQNK